MFRAITIVVLAASLFSAQLFAAPKVAKAVQGGSLASEFTLNDLTGKSYSLNSLRGKEIPMLNKIEAELGGNAGFKLLAINLDSDIEKAKKLSAKKQIKYTTLYDNGSAVAQQYGVSGIPANFVIGADGAVMAYGPDIEAAYAAIKKALADGAGKNSQKNTK
jgi:peroxiredoxin